MAEIFDMKFTLSGISKMKHNFIIEQRRGFAGYRIWKTLYNWNTEWLSPIYKWMCCARCWNDIRVLDSNSESCHKDDVNSFTAFVPFVRLIVYNSMPVYCSYLMLTERIDEKETHDDQKMVSPYRRWKMDESHWKNNNSEMHFNNCLREQYRVGNSIWVCAVLLCIEKLDWKPKTLRGILVLQKKQKHGKPTTFNNFSVEQRQT